MTNSHLSGIFERLLRLPSKLVALALLVAVLSAHPSVSLCQNTNEVAPKDSVSQQAVSSDTLDNRKSGLLNVLFGKRAYPDPGRALAYSLIVPGAGQFYNKKYVKVGLVYAGFFGILSGINWQGDREDRFQTALELKLDNLPHEFSGTSLDSERALRSRRDQYRKNRELMTIGLGLFYLLNGMDAYVDAHLLRFDVSEDLTLHLSPVSAASGPGLCLSLKQQRPGPTPQPFY